MRPNLFLLIGIQIFNIKYGGKELKSTKEDNKNISLIIDKRGGGVDILTTKAVRGEGYITKLRYT